MDVSYFASTLEDLLIPNGFECHPFKISWYNEKVAPSFRFNLPENTLAFIIISRPDMFEKAFKSFITKQHCVDIRDPIDNCMSYYFDRIAEAFPNCSLQLIHDFDMDHSHRPKVLVQTAGHVAGAAYYYQRKDVHVDPWPADKKIFGVSIHPRFGGWFAFRGIIIFNNVEVPELEQKLPLDVVSTDELKIELLNRFNTNWKDWTFRDIIPVESRYSDEQKLYFETLPSDRLPIVEQLKNKFLNDAIS